MHPIRKLDNVVMTPHLGYVTAENYHRYYGGMVEDIRSWLDGKPIREMQLSAPAPRMRHDSIRARTWSGYAVAS